MEYEHNVDRLIEKKLQTHKEELLADIGNLIKISNKSNTQELTKISSLISSDTPKFKRKSNEEQHKINKKVLLKLEDANRSETLQDSKAKIKQAMEMLEHRQKLICLADTNDLGWRVVNEYESNPLADDSDDEKRIYKAEVCAARKLKAERGKRTRSRFAPYQRGPARQTPRASPTSTAQVTKPGLCFQCGKPGHWRLECPGNTSSNNKISECLYSCSLPGVVRVAQNNKSTENLDSDVVVQNKNKPLETQVCFKNIEMYQQNVDMSSKKESSAVGRLKEHISMWRLASTDPYIVSIIENGYKLPFKSPPCSTILKNNKSAKDNAGFVSNEIRRLLSKGVIKQVNEIPTVVNPLTVAYGREDKKRLVLDCRHINPHLHVFKVKFEDIKVAESLFVPNSYVFTYDLKNAYHHIDIFAPHTTYLGFSWVVNGQKRYFVYVSLPFGIKTAGHIFTKTLRVVVKYLRSDGHSTVMFLDDGIGGSVNYSMALKSSFEVKSTLLRFGFLLASEKCHWIPCKVTEWLGYKLNFNKNCFYIKENRIHKLEMTLEQALSQIDLEKFNLLPVRFLASIVGQIISSIHSIHGFGDPTNDSLVKHLCDAAKRLTSKPKQRMDVIDVKNVQMIFVLPM